MPRLVLPLVLLIVAACSSTRTLPERHDDPGSATQYASAKRTGSADARASLAAALESMGRLPRYSTEADAWVERRRVVADVETAVQAAPFAGWKPLGPGNIGGRTRAIAIDPADPAVIYAAGVSGGVWKTVNGGAEWRPLTDMLASIAVNSLAMHPTDPATLLAGTGEGYFREEVRGTGLPLRGNGIFLTSDGGTTWARLESTAGPDFHWVNDLVISRNDPDRVYAATRTGVWRSADFGVTWSRILESTEKGGCLELAARFDTGNDVLFASCGTLAGQATVYRTEQAGSATPGFEPVLSLPNMGRTSLAIAPSDPSVVYALAASNETGTYNQGLLGVYRSLEGGAAGTWEPRVTNTSPNLLYTMLLTNLMTVTVDSCKGRVGNVTMGWYCNTIAVDPVDADRVWVGAVDLFRSDDGGANWGVASYWYIEPDDAPFVHADVHAIVFHPGYDGVTNRTAWFATDGGVYRTDDATAAVATGPEAACHDSLSLMRFKGLNNGYGVTQFYHGAVSPDGRWFVGGTQDNGTILGSVDAGPDGWTMILGGDGTYSAIDPQHPDRIFAQAQFGSVYKSNDRGVSVRSSVVGLNDDFLFVTPLQMDPNEPSRLWIGGRRLWRSDDRANRWSSASVQLPAQVSAIAVAPGNSDLVLAGLTDGSIVRSDFARTAASISRWTTRHPRDGWLSWIAFDPSNPSVVYATYAGFGGSHLWQSLDAGRSWSSLGDGAIPDIPVHSVAVDPTRPSRLYLGTDLGVLVSLDRGVTWAVENTGFANVVTEAVVIGQGANGPAVYAFTHGRGAWRAELTMAPGRRRAVRSR